MRWYCEKCRKIHEEDELCPNIQNQLKQHPEWLAGIADFTVVAGEQALISSQMLDKAAQGINRIVGKQLSYEGTQRFARDIQVFKRLNEEPFSRSGAFSTPEKAKSYYENVLKAEEKFRADGKKRPGPLTGFESKLAGYGQEVDWLRMKKGEISSIYQKSRLFDHNKPGVDGETINRFTGKRISRTTIKASKNSMTKNSTGIKDVKEAIEKGTATDKDIIFGTKGTEHAARNAGLENPVVEKNSAKQIQNSNKRLEQKISDGQAVIALAMQQVGQKMIQGAIVGATVAVTVSTITTYVRYKSGELTIKEAFGFVAEDALKGVLVGAAMGAVTIFLPCGVIGFVAGIAIGVYFI